MKESERSKPKPRDTYKYVLKEGHKLIYRGVTSDLDRRAAEHKTRWPKSHIEQVGRKTTRAQALKWERQGDERRKHHK